MFCGADTEALRQHANAVRRGVERLQGLGSGGGNLVRRGLLSISHRRLARRHPIGC